MKVVVAFDATGKKFDCVPDLCLPEDGISQTAEAEGHSQPERLASTSLPAIYLEKGYSENTFVI
ncbi:Uncharacterized [Moorella glycerini]|uniref:Uncharacterized protein n=1 Tax=Neomoorella stamsii TaxID=1266720 RepID=A0A9X7J324_9FIRM|nr:MULTISPECIES: hypothetical protein [Moorella]PRR73110.1 hypothetical protein MOST_14750 [Moorella stamsii]CEP67748.1 Uncharacterized [Moorella glycerini]